MIEERQYIKDNLYEFFSEMLQVWSIDMPLIYENGNEPFPQPPFLMLSFRSTVCSGMPNYSTVKQDGETEVQRITQHMRRKMTMYGFGERAIDVLETIKSQLAVDIWVDKLRKRNLVIPQTMETLESPRVLETLQEYGASFDFYLTYFRVIETNPGYIESVGLNPGFSRQK